MKQTRKKPRPCQTRTWRKVDARRWESGWCKQWETDGLTTARRGLLDVLTFFDVEVGFCGGIGDCRCTHSFFNLAGHGQECLFYVCCVLGWCLKERNSKAICKFLYSSTSRLMMTLYLCNSIFNDFFITHIGLVSHEELIDAFSCITINLLKPLLDIIEWI